MTPLYHSHDLCTLLSFPTRRSSDLNAWSETYDSVENKTRDLEARALREIITGENPEILEIGCGTGKNTQFLETKAERVVAVDFSPEMLERAKAKICAEHVEFRRMDLREDWAFADRSFDLVTCSLALEHIENIDFVFSEASRVLKNGGRFYIGELHPFKQYNGTKARFETGAGVFELECFIHHVSEFFGAGKRNDFLCAELREWFDDDDRTQIPRLLTLVFEKKK